VIEQIVPANHKLNGLFLKGITKLHINSRKSKHIAIDKERLPVITVLQFKADGNTQVLINISIRNQHISNPVGCNEMVSK
jgi:hypothetical protein